MKILDCTLRDGGYVNGWSFGELKIKNIIKSLEKTGVDIIELGFLRDNIADSSSSNIEEISVINNVIQPKKENVMYSAMVEAFDPYPIEKLQEHTEKGVDLIRVCIWKKNMDEHIEYCRKIKEKGYEISIQPSRVEQYSKHEFIEMLEKVNGLNPYSVYVVDTWGTQSSQQIVDYVKWADSYLSKDIIIGYHGHNNKMQALDCASAVLNLELEHEICMDSCILGMGRGAGNLNTEIIMEYLNEKKGKKYDVLKTIQIAVSDIKPIYDKTPWGYNIYYFLSAIYGCNPNFATYFQENKLGEAIFQEFLTELTDDEKIIFSPSFIEEKLDALNH